MTQYLLEIQSQSQASTFRHTHHCINFFRRAWIHTPNSKYRKHPVTQHRSIWNSHTTDKNFMQIYHFYIVKWCVMCTCSLAASPSIGANKEKVVEFMILFQYTYLIYSTHESAVSHRKILIHEIKKKHIVLSLYWVSVRAVIKIYKQYTHNANKNYLWAFYCTFSVNLPVWTTWVHILQIILSILHFSQYLLFHMSWYNSTSNP
jgi:hypothetical protein